MRQLLDLTDPENSLIKYKTVQYPDGQQDFFILDTEYIQVENPSVTIIIRLINFMDLELLILATKALNNLGVICIDLILPYVLGARSDRKFREGGVNYLKDVIAPIINSLGFNSVNVIDPHSDVVEAVIENINIIPQNVIFRDFLNVVKIKDFVLVSPDAGALKKIYKIAKDLQLTNDLLVVATKHRDILSGDILSVDINTNDLKGKDCFIVDDICDGGRTFIELAKVLKEKNCGKLYLFTTHGIYSKGLKELYEHFDLIGTTDSIRDYKSSTGEFMIRNEAYINKFKVFNMYNDFENQY